MTWIIKSLIQVSFGQGHLNELNLRYRREKCTTGSLNSILGRVLDILYDRNRSSPPTLECSPIISDEVTKGQLNRFPIGFHFA